MRLAFADTLYLWCVQRIELALVLRFLGADTFGPFHEDSKACKANQRVSADDTKLALDITYDNVQDRALAFDGAPQPLELIGIGVAGNNPPAKPGASLGS